MNEQFSMLYTIIFLSAIVGSFLALKVGIEYWANYEIFRLEANELVSSLILSDYFDNYSKRVNLSANLMINVTDENIELRRGEYYESFSNSMNSDNVNIIAKDFLIIKNSGGLRVI